MAENGRKSTEIYRLSPVVRVFTQPGASAVICATTATGRWPRLGLGISSDRSCLIDAPTHRRRGNVELNPQGQTTTTACLSASARRFFSFGEGPTVRIRFPPAESQA